MKMIGFEKPFKLEEGNLFKYTNKESQRQKTMIS